MRGLIVAAVLLLGGPALAQQPPPKVTLSIEVDQARLIVDMLGAINCGTVTQLMVCQQAADLLRQMQAQLRAQVK